MIFNQVSKLGGKVLKGERSTPVVFYKTTYMNENKKSGESYSLKFSELFADRVVNNSPSFLPHEDLNDGLRSGDIPDFVPKVDYPNP